MRGCLRKVLSSSQPLRTRMQTSIRIIPLALLTLQYIGGSLRLELPLFIDLQWLSRLYMLEFLAIHSFPFMVALLSWNAPSDKARGLRIVGVLILAWIYSLGAHSMAGWPGVLALAPLMVGTYFGYLVKGIRRAYLPELAIRGGINFFVFILCSIIFDLPTQVESWDGISESIWAGTVYFGSLTFFEFKGWPERWAEYVSATSRQRVIRDDPAEPALQIPTTRAGLWSAAKPLLASGGLAIAPYAVLPFFAGWVGRAIEDAVGWQYDDEWNRVWYFALYVPAIALARSWQVKQATRDTKPERRRRLLISVWVVYAILGALSFFAGDNMEVDEIWTLENLVWIIVVDLPVLIFLAPMVWFAVGNERRA